MKETVLSVKLVDTKNEGEYFGIESKVIETSLDDIIQGIENNNLVVLKITSQEFKSKKYNSKTTKNIFDYCTYNYKVYLVKDDFYKRIKSEFEYCIQIN